MTRKTRFAAAFAFPVIVVLALITRFFIVESFRVASPAMYPTLFVGDQFLVVKYAYRGSSPARGDVVLFRYPRDESKDFVSRVVAVAGDTIQVVGSDVVLNGHPLTRCTLGRFQSPEGDGLWSIERNGDHRYAIVNLPQPLRDQPLHCVDSPCTIPEGHLFVLGDNRDYSFDSRFWGFVPISNVRGRGGSILRAAGEYRRGANANGEPRVPPELRAVARNCVPPLETR